MISTRSEDLLSIVRLGLQPRAVKPMKIIVVGAGMSGLVAAYELHAPPFNAQAYPDLYPKVWLTNHRV